MTITEMIDDLRERRATRAAAHTAYVAANDAVLTRTDQLRDALIAASGRKVGDIIKTNDGREARISHFRLADDGRLIAGCDGKTKSTGKWSNRVGFAVAINIKETVS